MNHEVYMRRCIELAFKGRLATQTNPMVGAVVVHDQRIIGEGWHASYGGPHAEVNAIRSVAPEDRKLLPGATLYVSLEPCCVQGKTPACTGLILEHKIPEVVVGSVDPDPRMQGRGIRLLRENGVNVLAGILKDKCDELIQRFSVNVKGKPYVMLKWACSFDHVMGVMGKNVAITSEISQWYTHKWRSEFHGILVGKNTVLTDVPSLNNRLYPGPSPARIVLDARLEIPVSTLNPGIGRTLVINEKENRDEGQLEYLKVHSIRDWDEVFTVLYKKGMYSIMVEGGAEVLSGLIREDWWHEARILRTEKPYVKNSDNEVVVVAPTIKGKLKEKFKTEETTTAFILSHD